jgi:hypothetical protein
MTSEYTQPLGLVGNVLYLDQTPAVLAVAVKSVTAAYTMQPLDRIVLADATSAPFTVTLPSAQGRHGQQALTVKRMNAGGNAVTVGAASGLIDGAATQSLGSQYARLSVVSDGTQWLIIGS